MTAAAPEGDLRSISGRLREEFDRAFSRPAATAGAEVEAFLAVTIRRTPFALRLHDIAGLFADRPVTRLPSPFPDLLGMAGFRGAVVPVFDLGALLGYPPVASTRWLVVTDRANPAALAFDQFERIELLEPGSLRAGPVAGSAATNHAPQVVRTADGPRPLIDVASIMAVIDGRVQQRGASGRGGQRTDVDVR